VAKLFDGEGLELWATPVKPKRGRPPKDAPKLIRRWRFSYRFAGKRNSASLGAYPTVSLADAPKKAEELRRQLSDGIDLVRSGTRKNRRSRLPCHDVRGGD
jgi:hypothetical protein